LLAIFGLDDAVVRFGTAVTSVPIASTAIVFVVTVSIFLKSRELATFLSGTIFRFRFCAVQALAQLAIFDVGFISAAVATVPIAAADIVVVIAEAVALELGSAAAFLEVINACITLFNVCAVLTFTFLAVFIVFGTATVAAIPIATSVVVVVIAVVIAFPIGRATTFVYGFGVRVAL